MNQSTDQPASDPRERPISRYELWAVVAITLLGAAVRFAFPSAMAIEHFDEGVYASNLLFPDRGDQYPDRHLYAPSLVPWLIEWSIIFFGDKGIAPMLPSLLFGTLTIPLIWWVGRQWFDPLAGIAAATLLSLSDFHIAFSRSALTDVPLCFWLLLAVYLFERGFRDLSWPTAIAAGVTTGLAWWTKYNGWLPLAISLSGLMAWSLFARRDERHFLRRLALWAVAAATAFLVWSPYWLRELPNGYAEVARNHSQYLVGFAGWNTGSIRQQDAIAAFNSPLSWSGLAIVIVGIPGVLMRHLNSRSLSELLVGRPSPIGWCVGTVLLAFMAICGMVTNTNRFLFWMAMVGLVTGIAVTVILCIKRWQLRNSAFSIAVDPRFAWLLHCDYRRADWLLAAWAIGLMLSVPLYRPYPRLMLPLLVGIVLLFSRWVGGGPPVAVEPHPLTLELRIRAWFFIGLTATLLALLLRVIPIPADSFLFRCWETRSQFREIARDVTGDTLRIVQADNKKPVQNMQAVLYIYAEPGLFFHLPADGLAVQPAGNLQFVDIEATRKLPTFLVTGPHAQRSKGFADEFSKRADQFELIASYPYDASDFVRLDDVSATQLRTHREPLDVKLYRVRIPE